MQPSFLNISNMASKAQTQKTCGQCQAKVCSSTQPTWDVPGDDVGSIGVSIYLLKIAAQKNWSIFWQLEDKHAQCLASVNLHWAHLETLLFCNCITWRVDDLLQCYIWDINTLFFIQGPLIAFMLKLHSDFPLKNWNDLMLNIFINQILFSLYEHGTPSNLHFKLFEDYYNSDWHFSFIKISSYI